MSIAADVTAVIDKIENEAHTLADAGKRILEEHLPAVRNGITDAENVLNEPFIAAYLGGAVKVPEHLVNVGLDFLSKLVAAWEGQPPAPGLSTAGGLLAADDAGHEPGNGPVGLDAQPDQPAA